MPRIQIVAVFLLATFVVHAQESRSSLLARLRTAPEDTAKITLYNNISRAYTGANNDSAVFYAQLALQLALKLDNNLYVGRSRNALAAGYLNTRKYPLAFNELNLSREIAEEENDKLLLGNVYHNLGNVYRAEENIDSATFFYDQALIVRRELNDSSGLAASLAGLGVCHYMRGDMIKALDYYYQVVPIREAMHDKKGLASVYFNIALIHVDRKEKSPALEVLTKAFDLYTELDNTAALASVCNTIGIVYVDDQNYDKGRHWYYRSLNMRTLLNDSGGIAECYTNIGNIFTLEKNYDSAFVWYRKTLDFLYISDVGHQINYLCNYTVAAAALGKIDSARWAVTQARVLATKENRPYLFIGLYGALSDFYEQTGQLDSALYYNRQYFALSDSLYRDESQKALGEMETKYQTTKKQKEIDDLTASQAQKDLQLISLSVGAGLLVILIGFVVYGSVQRKKTNRILAGQNSEISEKNKDITASITYARRIQQSVLPDEDILYSNVREAFIQYMPRDIVSGDFYWFRKEGSRLYVACADCTGHGVPGALVSVIGVNILEQVVGANKAISTGELLDELHRMMYTALHKDSLSRGSNDGMDIGVLCIDDATRTVEFSGASRSVFHFKGNQLEQIKGDRFSIGGVKEVESVQMFSTHCFPLVKGEAFYLFTDGYADQFGGPQNKKFMSKQFMELIASGAAQDMTSQQSKIQQAFNSWKGSLEQVDDVLVIGIRL